VLPGAVVCGSEATALVGAALIITGLVRPALLDGAERRLVARPLLLGWVNARIILTIAFALVLTPIGWVWRVTGHDPLGRHRKTGQVGCRTPRGIAPAIITGGCTEWPNDTSSRSSAPSSGRRRSTG
jgi:hypothetical protein